MGPAGATVGGNVLVPDVGKVVLAIDVVPSDLIWEVLDMLESLSDLRGGSVGVTDSAWVVDESVFASEGSGCNECGSEASHGCSWNGLENY